MKIDWKRKLASRKFWAALLAVIMSAMAIFGADAKTQEKVAGLMTTGGVLVCYILAESSADVAALKNENPEKEDDDHE